MPPHCDTLDGPKVLAAKRALDGGNMRLILLFAPKKAGAEVTKVFERTGKARAEGKTARNLADQRLFETVVPMHREGGGASCTGLKPAGLDLGPPDPEGGPRGLRARQGRSRRNLRKK